jgi:hypothetical protein
MSIGFLKKYKNVVTDHKPVTTTYFVFYNSFLAIQQARKQHGYADAFEGQTVCVVEFVDEMPFKHLFLQIRVRLGEHRALLSFCDARVRGR